jgi:hypothetical protein
LNPFVDEHDLFLSGLWREREEACRARSLRPVSQASELKLTGGDCDLFASAFVQLLAAFRAEQGAQQLDQTKTHRQVPSNKAASPAALKGGGSIAQPEAFDWADPSPACAGVFALTALASVSELELI